MYGRVMEETSYSLSFLSFCHFYYQEYWGSSRKLESRKETYNILFDLFDQRQE